MLLRFKRPTANSCCNRIWHRRLHAQATLRFGVQPPRQAYRPLESATKRSPLSSSETTPQVDKPTRRPELQWKMPSALLWWLLPSSLGHSTLFPPHSSTAAARAELLARLGPSSSGLKLVPFSPTVGPRPPRCFPLVVRARRCSGCAAQHVAWLPACFYLSLAQLLMAAKTESSRRDTVRWLGLRNDGAVPGRMRDPTTTARQAHWPCHIRFEGKSKPQTLSACPEPLPSGHCHTAKTLSLLSPCASCAPPSLLPAWPDQGVRPGQRVHANIVPSMSSLSLCLCLPQAHEHQAV